jgi:SAM-dependent methyltransferase
MTNEMQLGLLGWVHKSVSSRGLISTIKIAISYLIDFGYDLRYGTDTMQWVDLEELMITEDGRKHGNPYKATKARALVRLLKMLDLSKYETFVDFGAGKGRVLLIAAKYGFRKVVGVEIAKELCQVAQRNAEHLKLTDCIEVVESDVTHYTIRRDQTVFFLYNPFDQSVTTRVLQNIGASLRAYPRNAWLLYNTPKYHADVLGTGLFKFWQKHDFGGSEFMIYRTA